MILLYKGCVRMNNIVLNIEFPQDYRTGNDRNRLLDGRTHRINISDVSELIIGGIVFYIVDGYDYTSDTEVSTLLTIEGNRLVKVPLTDYSVLYSLAGNSRRLDVSEIQFLFGNNTHIFATQITSLSEYIKKRQSKEVEKKDSQKPAKTAVAAVPLTPPIPPIEKMHEKEHEKEYEKEYEKKPEKKHEQNKWIVVCIDEEGRRYILSSEAKNLNLNPPLKTVNYLPLEKDKEILDLNEIKSNSGFRLLTDFEYNEIKNRFSVYFARIKRLNIINYNNNYYVESSAYRGNGFGFYVPYYGEFIDYVLINNEQHDFFKKYYAIHNILRRENDIQRNINGETSKIKR